jgi:hypothetical protein
MLSSARILICYIIEMACPLFDITNNFLLCNIALALPCKSSRISLAHQLDLSA